MNLEPRQEMSQKVIRPGKDPTSIFPMVRWDYLLENRERLDGPAYLYNYPAGHECEGWWGEADHFIFPDGFSPPGPATREHIQQRIEKVLLKLGYQIVDAQPKAVF